MRTGTLIFTLFLFLIALGFVVSDDLQTRSRLEEAGQRMQELTAQIDQLTAEVSRLSGELNSARSETEACKATVTGQEAMAGQLEGRIRELERELALLKVRKGLEGVLGSNPVMLAGLLVYAVGATVLRWRGDGKIVVPWAARRRKDFTVRLSEPEMKAVIRNRRAHR